MAQRKPTGFVIYEGPSVLDGAPIVAIAVTASDNRKTGNMVQTYILRRDVHPSEALRTGDDASIRGDCKHRPALGGACYVVVARGPSSVYRKHKAGGYPRLCMGKANPRPSDYAAALSDLGAARVVRLGTYGDPMAVPAYVWQALVSRASGHTGYTHQWQNHSIDSAQREAITRLCMASADDPSEATLAQEQGLRTFRIRTASEPVRPREMVCPASEEAGKVRTCATCKACSGSSKPSAASVVIIAHGSKARRFIALRSLPVNRPT